MPSREYRDPSGTEWEVFEVHRLNDRPNTVRPALASGWLAFVSVGERRRLPQYPADWTQLSGDELLELLRTAFVAPEPIYPVMQAEGTRPERHKRPRTTPQSAPVPLPAPVPLEIQPATAAASAAPLDGGLPMPPPATVSGTLGLAGIDALVRAHARQARRDGTSVIQGMIVVKRALVDAGEPVTPETLRQLRKVFVEEFYFAR